MRILLDTPVARWAVVGSRSLSAAARRAILDADGVVVSAASVREIAIEHALGKGDMPVTAADAWRAFADAGYVLLPVAPEHALRVESLPPIRRDPFDRMLVAQALHEPLTLVTADPVVGAYGPPVQLA